MNSSPASEKWNKSTYINKKLTERRKMENHVLDPSKRFAYNFRAEELDTLRNPSNNNQEHYDILVKTTKKTTEMPNSYRLHESKAWNTESHYAGLSLLASKEMKKVFEERSLKSVDWCKTRNSKLLPDSYINPMESSLLLQEQVRELKRSGNFKDRLDAGMTTSLNGTSSQSRAFQSSQNVAPSSTQVIKYSNNKSRAYQVNKHSGVWEFNRIENRYMWSDTGSFEYKSKGDIDINIDPDSYNYVDPTLKTSVHTVM